MDIAALVSQFSEMRPLPHGLTLAQAQPHHIPQIMQTIEAARKIMRRYNNFNQWTSVYPAHEDIAEDVAGGRGVVCLDKHNTVVGYMALYFTPQDNYANISGNWLDDTVPYATIHRLAVRVARHGIGKILAQCAMSCNMSVRVDTHEVNTAMRTLLTNLGYQECGTVWVEDGTPRIAYQWLGKFDSSA